MLLVSLYLLLIWSVQVKSEYSRNLILKDKRLLNDGNLIPVFGFGTLTVTFKELDNLSEAVTTAVEAGYRLLDTAALYINEDIIGSVIVNLTKSGIVKRDDLFITTKLIFEANTREKVVPALKLALKRLQLDYVDLFLIHWPYNTLGFKKFDILDIWRGMEDVKDLGLSKSIGVSNFYKEHLNVILKQCKYRPAVNEIEVNPTYANCELVDLCQRHGIVVIAYAPFGFTVPRPGIIDPPPPSLNHPVLLHIANKYGVTTSQVVLRYLIDRGTIPIPRSKNKHHILSNKEVLKFSLTDEEVEKINKFDINFKVYGGNNTGDSVSVGEEYRARMAYANRRNSELYPLSHTSFPSI